MKPFTSEAARKIVLTLPVRHRGDGRGVGPGLRHSEQALLRLLLRFVRDEAGDVGFRWGTTQLARDLGYSYDATRYARRRLIELGYLEMTSRGDGEFRSTYRVVVERFQPSAEEPDSEDTVRPGEKALPAPITPVIGSPPGSDRVTPSKGSVHTPTHARAFFPQLPQSPLTPTGSAGGGTTSTTRCPTAWRRGEPCANCRACGTTKRQLAAAAAAAAKAGRVVPHCGVCDQTTRLEELTDGTLRRCPVCHPLRDEVAAVAGDDLVDRWAREHVTDLAEAGKPTNERETG